MLAVLVAASRTQGGNSSICLVKPKFNYADFNLNFPAGKVVNTNHESRRRDLYRGLSWFVFSTSPRLCREVVPDFVTKSA